MSWVSCCSLTDPKSARPCEATTGREVKVPKFQATPKAHGTPSPNRAKHLRFVLKCYALPACTHTAAKPEILGFSCPQTMGVSVVCLFSALAGVWKEKNPSAIKISQVSKGTTQSTSAYGN